VLEDHRPRDTSPQFVHHKGVHVIWQSLHAQRRWEVILHNVNQISVM
jgi:hypothetical protein